MQWRFFNLTSATILLALALTPGVMGTEVPIEFILSPGDTSRELDADSEGIAPFFGRYQQVYEATDFDETAAAGGGWIRDLAFRIDTPMGFGRVGVITNLQINLSTTERTPGSLSPVFAENVGLDDTVVYQPQTLQLLFAYSDAPFPSTAQPFNTIVFGFQTPFFYNPAAGNLLMDIRTGGATGLLDPSIPFLDAWNRSGDSVGRVFGGIGATAGTADTIGLVTGFGVQVVPEPSTLILLLAAGLAVLFVKRRKRT